MMFFVGSPGWVCVITYECDTRTARVTLNRPEKRNALDLAGWHDLREALQRAETEAAIAIVAGAGEAFCAGDDIQTLADMATESDATELADHLHEGLFGMETLSIPVIAAVDGPAVGGGFELVAAADLAVATTNATFALPECRVGAFPPYALARIGDLCGKKRLMELSLTGEPIDARTAHEWGLVNTVVPEGGLEEGVAEFVTPILESPPDAISMAKEYTCGHLHDPDERDRIRHGFSRIAASEDCTEAARSFLDGSG